MIDIEAIQCTACEACINACPQKCISLMRTEYLEEKPYIDSNHCINCGVCEKVCPQTTMRVKHTILHCYAAFRNDKLKRADSSSGGIASLFYEHAQKQGMNIYGVKYTRESGAIYTMANSSIDVELFKGSKYVHASMGGVYTCIENQLNKEENVFFIGLPCQVAGLLNYLERKHVKCDNLITVDLLCHGTCPSDYLIQEVDYIKKKLNLSEIYNVTFRSNRPKRLYSLILYNENAKVQKSWPIEFQPYFYGFLRGITLRENCYYCQYATSKRVADITIGDFIDLGKIDGFPEFNWGAGNNSIVLANTEKGNYFIQQLDKNEISIFEREIAEGIKQGISLRESFPKHMLRERFLDYMNCDTYFPKAIRKTVGIRIAYNRYLCRYINFISRKLKLPTLRFK